VGAYGKKQRTLDPNHLANGLDAWLRWPLLVQSAEVIEQAMKQRPTFRAMLHWLASRERGRGSSTLVLRDMTIAESDVSDIAGMGRGSRATARLDRAGISALASGFGYACAWGHLGVVRLLLKSA